MNLLDELETGPIARWRRHGQLPLRCLSHVAVVLVLIIHIFSLNEHLTVYSLGVSQTSTNWFQTSIPRVVKQGFHYDKEDFRDNNFEFLNTTSTRAFLLNFVNYYYEVNSTAADVLHTDQRLPELEYSVENHQTSAVQSHRFSFTEKEWRDFISTHILTEQFFRSMVELRLSLWVKGLNLKQRRLLGDSCVRWHFLLTLEHKTKAAIVAELRQEDARTCAGRGGINRLKVVAILSFLILGALVHAVFAALRIRKGCKVLNIVVKLYEQDNRDGTYLPFREKLTILNVWVLISLFGDVLVVAYALMQLNAVLDLVPSFDMLDTSVISDVAIVVLGLGTIALLLGLLEYAQYGFKSYLFLQICEVARRDVLPSLLLLIPILIAYAILGLCLFGDRVDRFSTLGRAISTLFSVSFGDEIWVTIHALAETETVPHFFVFLYIVSFIFFFNYIFAMTTLATVEEVYITEGHWLYSAKKGERPSPHPGTQRRPAFNRSRSLPPRAPQIVRKPYQRSGVSLNVSQRTAQYLMSRSFDERNSRVDT